MSEEHREALEGRIKALGKLPVRRRRFEMPPAEVFTIGAAYAAEYPELPRNAVVTWACGAYWRLVS